MGVITEHIETIDKEIEKIKADDKTRQKVKDFFVAEINKSDLVFILDKMFSLNFSNIELINQKLNKLRKSVDVIINKYKNEEDILIDGNCFKNEVDIICQVGLCIKNDTELDYKYYEKLSFVNKIKSYKFLHEDWDSYGANIISRKSIKASIEFIAKHKKYKSHLKFVYPSKDGMVGLEYENKNKRIGFKIHDLNNIDFYNFNNQDITTKTVSTFFKNIE